MTKDLSNMISRFTSESLAFCDELKIKFADIVSVLESSAKEFGKDIAIQVEWLRDSDFNASAEIIEAIAGRNGNPIQGGTYRISISEGLLIKLIYSYEILLTLMSRTSTRPPLDSTPIFQNPSTSDALPEYVFMPNYFDLDINASLVDLDVPMFNDEAMAESIEKAFWPFQLGERLIDEPTRQHVLFAVTFLALHEGSHIIRGHLDYLHDKLNLRAISECHSFSDAKGEVEMRQLMEIDADQQSMFNILNNYIDEEVNDIQTFATVCTTSLVILFSLFDMTIRSASNYKLSFHPDPDVRVLASVNYASTVYGLLRQKSNLPSGKAFGNIMLNSLYDSGLAAVRAFQELGVLGGGPQRLVAMSQDVLWPMMEKLVKSALKAQDLWNHRMRSSYKKEDFFRE